MPKLKIKLEGPDGEVITPPPELPRTISCTNKDCKMKFKTKQDRCWHVRRVHRSPIKCPHKTCNSYVKPAGLSQHIRRVHDRIMETCPYCNEKFQKERMYYHRQFCANGQVKKFKCLEEGCNAVFATSYEQKGHMRNHRDKIRCPRPGCTKWFKEHNLLEHIKSVHDKLKVKCERCGKEYAYGGFNRHRKRCQQNCKVEFEDSVDTSNQEKADNAVLAADFPIKSEPEDFSDTESEIIGEAEIKRELETS